jgi:hypothetical protein
MSDPIAMGATVTTPEEAAPEAPSARTLGVWRLRPQAAPLTCWGCLAVTEAAGPYWHGPPPRRAGPGVDNQN